MVIKATIASITYWSTLLTKMSIKRFH